MIRDYPYDDKTLSDDEYLLRLIDCKLTGKRTPQPAIGTQEKMWVEHFPHLQCIGWRGVQWQLPPNTPYGYYFGPEPGPATLSEDEQERFLRTLDENVEFARAVGNLLRRAMKQ